ncbi:malonyl-CoA decarboxylase-domain-containing protein [Dissophora ornata]|nr:malonyl-CoA decarboxylase-domain-containing protein [Dissophora ornata]
MSRRLLVLSQLTKPTHQHWSTPLPSLCNSARLFSRRPVLQIRRTMASFNDNNSGDSGNNNNNDSNSTINFTNSAVGSGTLQALKANVVDRYWNDIAEHFREPGFSTFVKENSSLVTRDREFMRKLLLAVIADRPGQGDILPSVIAKSSCDFFTSLDKAGKTEFLRLLARDFGVLQEDVVKAAKQYTNCVSVEPESRALLRAEQLLRHSIVPGHNKFFDRVSRLPGGLKFLIDMRQDLMTILHENRSDFYLAALSESLKEKLQSWFVGFLDLERLTWQSPAVLLEKITQYEAVHKFKDSHDLKRRVGPGRRVFALMNKSLPTEPLVFVQVALVEQLSSNVQDILDDPSPGHANPAETIKCAIFYSITTQVGLSGIELGNFLIKRVVRSLKLEFPQIETFSTLSPIPGFRKWINQCQKLGQKLLLPKEEPVVAQLGRHNTALDTEAQFNALLKDPITFLDSERMGKIQPILTRLCARYILLEKRRHLALDPVANFHLRNGACAHRLNWLGDTSDKGMEESFGLMINYLYSLDHIEMNNQQYLQDGTISVSSRDPGFESSLVYAKTDKWCN